MRLHTLAMVCVVGPLSLISLALDLSELSVAVGVSQVPSSLVRRPILEKHGSAAMTETAEPVAFVHRATRLVSMLFLSELFGQLCLIYIVEQVQSNCSSRINRLI